MSEEHAELIARAPTSLPPDKQVYFNGYLFAVRAMDVVITLQVDAEPVIVLRTPLGVAKSFIEQLSESLSNFENALGIKFSSLNEVNNLILEKIQEQQAKAKENDEE